MFANRCLYQFPDFQCNTGAYRLQALKITQRKGGIPPEGHGMEFNPMQKHDSCPPNCLRLPTGCAPEKLINKVENSKLIGEICQLEK